MDDRHARTRSISAASLFAVLLVLGSARGQATFTDDFERPDGPPANWTVVNGPWTILDGALTVTATGTEASVWAGDPPLKADVGDMEITAKVAFGAAPGDAVGRHGGFLFCASQPSARGTAGFTGYTMDWFDGAGERGLRLYRWDAGAGGAPVAVRLFAGTPLLADVPLEWTIQLDLDLIRVLADGEPAIEFSDATYRGGHVGIWAYQNGTSMTVDDVQITYPAIELDACFTASDLAGFSPFKVDFDASCTQSVHGVASLAWDFGDGDTGTGATPSHTYLFGGSYMVTLTVRDTIGNEKTYSVTIEVQESAGSFSDDFERPDGPVDGWTVHTGSWNIEGGKLTTTTGGTENWAWAGDPAFAFPANFTMTFTLEFVNIPGDVVGRHGGVMFCSTRPTWRYDPMISGYTIDWIDRVGDHGIRLYRWDMGRAFELDIGARDVPNPPVDWQIVVEGEVIRVFGDGVVYLEARDSTYRQGVFGLWGYQNSLTLALDDVEVSSPELSPCFTTSPVSAAEVGTEVSFDAGCSTASGTPIVTYAWDFGDGATAQGVTAAHTYTTEGLRTARLTITTEGALSASTDRTIEVFVPRDSFEDDFNRTDGPPSGWRVASGTWSLASGKLRVEDPEASVLSATTFAGDPALRFAEISSVEVSVDFLQEAPVNTAIPGRHGGIIIFSQTTAAWGQFSSGYSLDWIDRAGDHGYRLLRFNNGVPQVIATGGVVDTDPGQNWRIEIEGATIRLVVDGVLQFEAADATYRTGHIGFWAYPGDPANGFVQTIEFDDLVVGSGGPEPTGFHRGDANGDGTINITDGIFVLNYLFLGGPTPSCLEAANPNDDAAINITDGIFILNFLFLGGPTPASPGPTGQPCGPDPVGASALGCESYTKC